MTRQKLLIQAPQTQSPRPVFRERVFNRHPPGTQRFGAAGQIPRLMSDERCEIVNEKLLTGCAMRSPRLSPDNAAPVTPLTWLTARQPEADTPKRPPPTRPLLFRRGRYASLERQLPAEPPPAIRHPPRHRPRPTTHRATARDRPPRPLPLLAVISRRAAVGRLTLRTLRHFTHQVTTIRSAGSGPENGHAMRKVNGRGWCDPCWTQPSHTRLRLLAVITTLHTG